MIITYNNAFKIEQEVARILHQQELNGVLLDVDKAVALREQMENEREALYNKARPMLTPVVTNGGYKPIMELRKKDGEYSKRFFDFVVDSGLPIETFEGAFSRVWFEEPNLNSPKQLVDILSKLGWKPTEFTPPSSMYPKGQPKVTEDSLKPFLTEDGEGLGSILAKWNVLKHRYGLVNSFLDNLREDGRVPARYSGLTNTYRLKHSIVTNVPKASDKVYYGKALRSLFCTKHPYRFVGYDATNLELRLFTHHLADPGLIHEVVAGDFHSVIWNAIKDFASTRDSSKNFTYAFLYGASDHKLGTMCDTGIKEKPVKIGKNIRHNIENNVPGVGDLVRRVTNMAKKGFVIGIDGRPVRMRKGDSGDYAVHKGLNTLLQSDGAILLKYAMVYIYGGCEKEGLDVLKVIDMHDESQSEVHEDCVDRFKELVKEGFEYVEDKFKLKFPFEFDLKVGYNWAETH